MLQPHSTRRHATTYHTRIACVYTSRFPSFFRPVITTYAFGTEEHTYSGTGTLQSNTYYYSLGGRLIGELTGSPTPLNTSIFLTDALGSVLATFSNTAGSAALLGNQVYGPFGTQRYTKGAMGTNKGFTGQYNDSLTGLDYYNARYYDPVAAVFLSVDIKQGNLQGMNPYDYVGGNPETHNDPTGEMYAPPRGGGGSGYTPPVNNLTRHAQELCQVNGWCTMMPGPLTHPTLQALCSEDPGCTNLSLNQQYNPFNALPFFGSDGGIIGGGGDLTDAEMVQQLQQDGVLDAAGQVPRDSGVSIGQFADRLGKAREQYVLDNLSSLIPDLGGNLQSQKDFTIKGVGRAKADFVTDTQIIEVGGPGKATDPTRFGQQISVYAKSAKPGQKVYYLYDNSFGPLPESLQKIANRWGVQVIQFTLPFDLLPPPVEN